MFFAEVTVVLSILFGFSHARGHYEVSAPGAHTSVRRNAGRKLVCYFQPTSYFSAADVPGSLCTHLIYAFGTITSDGQGITPPSGGQAAEWSLLTSLRAQNPGLSILLSLQKDFNLVVGPDSSKMSTFAQNAVAFLRKYQFDGLDLDWEYPNSSQRDYFAQFFKILRGAIKLEALANGQNQLQLSLALPNNQRVAELSYDLPTIASNVDFATAMTYDFHLFLKNIDTKTGYNSPLYTTPGDNKYYSASAMATYYLSKGFTAGKLLMGIPTYGRSWQLASPSSHGLHAQAVGKGSPGPYRHLTGVYTYPDACTTLKQGGQTVRDTDLGALYLYNGSTWVAYENMDTVVQKAAWAVEFGLGGVGVWSMALDDVSNTCGNGTFPLLNALNGVLLTAAPIDLLFESMIIDSGVF